MRTVFADANYWIGLFNPKDALHEAAMAASRGLSRTRLVTSEMVLVEVLNGLGKFMALRAFRQHADKEWGLTDCSSFVIMRLRGLREALTYDHHFEQAGFVALLRVGAN